MSFGAGGFVDVHLQELYDELGKDAYRDFLYDELDIELIKAFVLGRVM